MCTFEPHPFRYPLPKVEIYEDSKYIMDLKCCSVVLHVALIFLNK